MSQLFNTALTFLRQWLWLIIAVAVVVAGTALLRGCNLAHQANEIFQRHPPLPNKEVKAIIARGKADSARVIHYQQIAQSAVAKADSLQSLRRTATTKAKTIHAQIIRIPRATGGPISAIQQRLANYTPADTTGF